MDRFLMCTLFSKQGIMSCNTNDDAATTSQPFHSNTSNLNLSNLQNQYWVVRHGQSEANVQKIISSHPEMSTKCHGLSSLGREEATQAGKILVTELRLAPPRNSAKRSSTPAKHFPVVVISSDYLRAKETAELIVDELGKHVPFAMDEKNINDQNAAIPLRYDVRLRERSFGTLHGTSDSNYAKVWDYDQKDANHNEFHVESVISVFHRTTQLLLELEKEFSQTNIILVAHGDVLQILQTAFTGNLHPRLHRSLPHLPTATPRELFFVPSLSST
jgi:broad specificity phosphatase PhoE